MNLKLAEIYRGDEIESIHYGIACLTDSSKVLDAWGDPNFSCFTRSLNKPIQAQAVLESGLILKDELLAIASSSHRSCDYQIKEVKNLLKEFDLQEEVLKCGLRHFCSGKHAAILAVSKKNNWDLDNYLELKHPVQKKIVEELSKLNSNIEIKTAVDGCGLPTFYMSLKDMAFIFSSMINDNRYQGLIKAMNKYPFLIGGEKQADSIIMNNEPNRFIAKGGAEGLFVVSNLENSQTLLVKILDGGDRAKAHIALKIMEELKWVKAGSIKLDNALYDVQGNKQGFIKPCLN